MKGLLQVPTKRWQAVIWLVDRGIVAGMALLISIAALMTRQGEILLELGILGFLFFLVIYFFIAK